MKFVRFDPSIHESSKVAELILYSTGYIDSKTFRYNEIDNFLSGKFDYQDSVFENIYLVTKDNLYLGVIIFSKNQKSIGLFSLIKLIINLKIRKFIESIYLLYLNKNDKLENGEIYLDLIYIDPQYRNRGIGTFFMINLISLIQKKELKKIKLHVDPKNFIARNFYQKLGFEYTINPIDISGSEFLEMAYNIK